MCHHSALDAGVKLRPTEEELKQIGPDFAARWKEHFVDSPDKPVMWMGPVSMSVILFGCRCLFTDVSSLIIWSPCIRNVTKIGLLVTGPSPPIPNTSPWDTSYSTPPHSDMSISHRVKMYTLIMTLILATSRRKSLCYSTPIDLMLFLLIYSSGTMPYTDTGFYLCFL